MDHRSKLVISGVLALFAGSASASFQSLVPPVGWSESMGKHYYKPAAAEIFDAAGRMVGKTSVNLAGRSLAIPFSQKMASTAGAAAARLAFANPALMVLTAGTLAYSYWNDETVFLDTHENGDAEWMKNVSYHVCTSDCFEIRGMYTWGNFGTETQNPFTINPSAACASTANAAVTGYWKPPIYSVMVSECTPIYTKLTVFRYGVFHAENIHNHNRRSIPPYEIVERIPATEQDLLDRSQTKPITPEVINQWPQSRIPFPVPVDAPVLNPSDETTPRPQPLRVPQGSPQPVPNTDPQQWKTPVIDVTPSPSTDDPWRVDVTPKDILKTDSSPLPDTDSVPLDPPNPDDPPLPEEQPVTADLCEKHPEIIACQTEFPKFCEENPDVLACQKISELTPLEPDPLIENEKQMSITPGPDFGVSGSCPAPKTVTVLNTHLTMPFTLLCDFALMIKPLLIGFAWLSAALTFFGLGRRES